MIQVAKEVLVEVVVDGGIVSIEVAVAVAIREGKEEVILGIKEVLVVEDRIIAEQM
jgi:hypothetical protein